MRNENPEFRIFAKEWRARGRLLALLGGVMLLILAFVTGLASHPVIKGALDQGFLAVSWFSAFAFATLGVRLFSNDEADPARAFIYQLPVSRARLLGIKLAALATQLGVLLILSFASIGIVILMRESYPVYGQSRLNYNHREMLGWIEMGIGNAFFLAFLGAIVSLHMRSTIVALIVTLALGWALNQIIPVPGFQFPLYVRHAIATLALGGWLFFLFSRTAIMEARPSARGLLVFLFAVGAAEVFYTIFYTGWRDLAYLVFGW